MLKVKVDNIDNYNYTLIYDNKKYIKNIEFIGYSISIGDYIYLDDDVINSQNIYTYGPIKGEYKDSDIIKIIHNNEQIFMQRYYG